VAPLVDIGEALQEDLRAPGPGEAEPAVLVAADLNYDYIHDCPALEGGREVLIRGFSRELAGAGGIVACGLARLGAEVHLLAELGDDAEGRELYEEIGRRGVRRGGLRLRPGVRSAFTLIFADEASGRPRQVATWQGPSLEFSPRAEEYLPLLGRCALAYSCNYFLLPRLAQAVPELFRQARARGALTAYDANAGDGWREPARLRLLREGIYPAADLIFLNEDEAAWLTGQEDALRAAREVGPAEATVVVKRGPRGAVVRHRGATLEVEAFPLPGPLRDTVGAGDSFQAAFLYFLLRGRSVGRCAALASANAACSVLAPGGTAGQQDRAGLASFLRGYRVLEGPGGGIRVARASPDFSAASRAG
jgi:sugar/nucleoside kinase (ribokinase family)